MPTVNKLKLVARMTHDCNGNINFSRNNSSENFAHYLTNGQRWTNSPPEPGSPIRTQSPPILRTQFSNSFPNIPEEQELTFSRSVTLCDYLRSALATIFLWPFLVYPLMCEFFELFVDGQFLKRVADKVVKLLDIPLLIMRKLIISINRPYCSNNQSKTVMLSSGSTVQALYLARHLSDFGVKVVVFDFEQNYALSQYSTAVSKYHKLPDSAMVDYCEYIACLTRIVRNENVTHYIPICATNMAHFDAMAKPHLKHLNCKAFILDLDDTTVVQDIMKVLKKCESSEISVGYYALNNRYNDVYTTCTTVINGRVVSNITSLNNTLKVVENEKIENWVNDFFKKFKLSQPINGYFTLEVAQSKRNGDVRLKNISVGMSRLYVCQSKIQGAILSNESLENECLEDKRTFYMLSELILMTLLRPSLKMLQETVKTLLNGKEILFSIKDPLPFLTNYLIRLPYELIVNYI